MLKNKAKNRKYIWSEAVDFWTSSGASILALFLFIATTQAYNFERSSAIIYLFFTFQLLINWPHFIVSYKLLYSNIENIRNYYKASIILPIILGVIITTILILSKSITPETKNLSLELSYYLWVVASIYLAWHYIGQAWGCFIIFSILDNLKINSIEKTILYWSYRVLILWHVIWAIQTIPKTNKVIELLHHEDAMHVVNIAFVASLTISILIFIKIINQQCLKLRTISVWFTTYIWYLALYFNPLSIFIVQLSHALQYLPFALRVEANKSSKRQITSVVTTYIISVAIGGLIFMNAEAASNQQSALPTVIGLIAIAINIHHYYVDSSIWKLRSKETQSTLFAHLK